MPSPKEDVIWLLRCGTHIEDIMTRTGRDRAYVIHTAGEINVPVRGLIEQGRDQEREW